MHRMDLRRTRISEVNAAATPAGDKEEPSPPPRRLLRFDPTEPEPDVKEMVDKSAVSLRALDARLRILNWAYSNFKREYSTPCDPDMWRGCSQK